MALHRRTIIRALGPLVTVGSAGCTSMDGTTGEGATIGGTIDVESPEGNSDTGDTTRTSSPWTMDNGTSLVSVTVEEEFSGDVVLEADCRAEDVIVSPGTSGRIVRKEHGEDCPIRLLADGDELYFGFVRMDQSIELTVRNNAEVDETIAVI